jgi:hypothetical protein
MQYLSYVLPIKYISLLQNKKLKSKMYSKMCPKIKTNAAIYSLYVIVLAMIIHIIMRNKYNTDVEVVKSDKEGYDSIKYTSRFYNQRLYGHETEKTHNDIHEYHPCHTKTIFDSIHYHIGQVSDQTLFSAHPRQMIRSPRSPRSH